MSNEIIIQNEVVVKENESIDDLQLKGLKLIQKKDSFRFGVDAVLLSEFANIKKNFRVIDLCTGTGIVPFLILGKYEPKEIVGIEVQEEIAEMANRSTVLNNVEDKIKTWQRLTLPHGLPCSTISAVELNFPVRNGKECFLYAIITRYYDSLNL